METSTDSIVHELNKFPYVWIPACLIKYVHEHAQEIVEEGVRFKPHYIYLKRITEDGRWRDFQLCEVLNKHKYVMQIVAGKATSLPLLYDAFRDTECKCYISLNISDHYNGIFSTKEELEQTLGILNENQTQPTNLDA